MDWLINRKVKIYTIDWLHAKIYLNEHTVLISSMNILKSSISNSLDFIMIVRNAADEDKAREKRTQHSLAERACHISE